MNAQRELLNTLRIDRNAAPAPASRKGWVAGGVVLVALGIVVAIYLSLSGKNPPPSAPPSAGGTQVPAMDTRPVVESGEEVLSASGYITARRMATVASRITGLIEEVRVEEGMVVKAGDVLATLDPDIAQVQLELAKAQVQAAAAEADNMASSLAEAKRVLARVTRLKQTNYSSEAAVTEARAAAESFTARLAKAQADVAVARQQVALQQAQLDEHVIRAPFAGVVTDKNAQPGEVVSPMSAGGGFTRTGICTIVDMDSLEIEVDVNEAFIGRVGVGQAVRANLDAYPEWDIKAHVVAIIPTANRDKATVRVRIGIDAEDPRILPDMGVKVAFLK